jgi:membrane dipeptidase
MRLSHVTTGVLALVVAGATVRLTEAQTPAAAPPTAAETALVAKARAIHDRVIALDTHDDINVSNFTFSRNYTQDLGNQVNLPKMKKGGLDAAFFIVYVGQSTQPDAFEAAGYQRAYDDAVSKFEAIHRLTKVLAPDQIELALTAADVRRIQAKGKKVALIGVENGYPLGDSSTAVARVKEFYDRGGRYMSLAHNGHSQLSDSNTGEASGWKWNGLSPLGKEVLVAMNKWGIMIDISHPSKESMMQALKITKAPIIASHSAVRALADHSRNMDDEQMMALKANGGVMQVVAFASYVKTDSKERRDALNAVRAEFKLPPGTNISPRRGGPGGGAAGRGGVVAGGGPVTVGPGAAAAPAGGGGQGRGGNNPLASLSEEQRTALTARVADVDAKFPPPARATVKDFLDHIDYAVKKMGLEHVGISSDFDGGGGVDGWNGAEETFNVTLELVRRGYTEAQIGKMWSGNLLRVMDEVQKVAKTLQESAPAPAR